MAFRLVGLGIQGGSMWCRETVLKGQLKRIWSAVPSSEPHGQKKG